MHRLLLALATCCAALPGAGTAEENRLFLLQSSPDGNVAGNTIRIDQSQASNSTVAGDATASAPALQVGSGNTASVTAAGERSTVLFSQGAIGQPAFDNTARLNLDGTDLTAQLQQLGFNNVASVNLGGARNAAAITQEGDNLAGTVNVSGSDNSGTLNQRGSGQVFELTVDGSGTAVTYNLIGNNVTAGAAGGPTVFSNAGEVTVTTTVLGR